MVDIIGRKPQVVEHLPYAIQITGLHDLAGRLREKLTLNGIHVADYVSEPVISPTVSFQSSYPIFVDDLKKFYQTFSKVTVIPQLPYSSIPIDKLYVNLQMQTEFSDPQEGYQMLLDRARCNKNPVICQGKPGGGKSTLLKKICFDWSTGKLPQYDIVLLCRLREMEQANSVLELCLKWIQQYSANKELQNSENVESFMKNIAVLPASRVLILLDALDEKVPDCWELKRLFFHDIASTLFPTVVTTTPHIVRE